MDTVWVMTYDNGAFEPYPKVLGVFSSLETALRSRPEVRQWMAWRPFGYTPRGIEYEIGSPWPEDCDEISGDGDGAGSFSVAPYVIDQTDAKVLEHRL